MAGNTNNTEISDSLLHKRRLGIKTATESECSSTPKKSKLDTVSKSLDSPTNVSNSNSELKSFVIEADSAEDKGARHSMEDVSLVLLDDFPRHISDKLRFAHFAVYDGHGGRLAAEYAKKHLNFNVISAGFPLGC